MIQKLLTQELISGPADSLARLKRAAETQSQGNVPMSESGTSRTK